MLIASTIAAIGQYVETSLINLSSCLTKEGNDAICLYADTDSVFINTHAVNIIRGNEHHPWFKGGYDLLRVSEANAMFDLK